MKHLSKDIATFFTFAIICSSFLKCQAFSSAPWMTGGNGSAAYPATPEQREEVVRRYFDGVNRKDSEQIKSCFADKASITDICSINASKRVVESDLLAERCMEFLTAHPDCKVCILHVVCYCVYVLLVYVFMFMHYLYIFCMYKYMMQYNQRNTRLNTLFIFLTCSLENVI